MRELNTFFQDISIRRRVVITVGIFSVLIIVTGMYGLLAIIETNHRLHKSILEGQIMIKTVDTARLAQTHFKKQVQEWKNILLRGNDQKLYEQYFKSFENEERLVKENLLLVEKMADSLKFVVPQIRETIKVHERLGNQYREALNSYKSADLKSAVAVDIMVRGIDREPTDRIDEIVDSLKRQADKRLLEMELLAKTKVESYQGIAFFLVFLVLAGIGFGVTNAYSIINELPADEGKNGEGEDQ
jgi:methyl-accepting chemotaxis protein